MLARPRDLSLVVAVEGGDFGPPRRRLRAHFNIGGSPYSLVVTDPWIEARYLARGVGSTDVRDSVICVSLAEEFHGYAYKLAASVITPDRAKV